MAAYLFEHEGCFRYAEGSGHAEMMGIEQDGEIGLPSRAADAMFLEQILIQVISRAEFMLKKINDKFVRSEQNIEFREQLAPGIFKLNYRGFKYKENKNSKKGSMSVISVQGRRFNCVTSVARAYGMDPVTVRKRISDIGKKAEELSEKEWEKILTKKKAIHICYGGKTYTTVADFCRAYHLIASRVYPKIRSWEKNKGNINLAGDMFWQEIIDSCSAKFTDRSRLI
ncbi:hypothetical protein [Edwardsiella tarda]|uniref:Uncharacterized protein n=1 Tax=Edwardsiella anguillarum ET080813 TaxID=667120 RepID=A0A076LRQ4_9GAMM|nr:Hypothetical protein ETEE_p1060 [Edwardsiella anguillarum ET080813]